MLYQFKTTATMKEYNKTNWWIDSDIVREITVDAGTLREALEKYHETVKTKYCINISNDALKTKKAMYQDQEGFGTVQVGYVITASTEFDSDYRGWVKQYIDLWVTVQTIQNPFLTSKHR